MTGTSKVRHLVNPLGTAPPNEIDKYVPKGSDGTSLDF
jgi:hypothetical protein